MKFSFKPFLKQESRFAKVKDVKLLGYDQFGFEASDGLKLKFSIFPSIIVILNSFNFHKFFHRLFVIRR